MQEYEGKRVVGPNGERGVIRNGQIVPETPAPGGLRQVVAAPPKEPSPQTPEQQQGDALRNTRTAQEIDAHPVSVEGQKLTNQDRRQSIQLTPQKTASDFIDRFKGDPVVKAYREVLPVIIGATQAQPGGAGDLSVVYGWAKTMDPNSVVREGEVGMAQSASGPLQRAQFLASKYRLQEGGSLPPQVRQQLIEEMRTKGRQLNLAYSQAYQQTAELLRRSGLDPSILGPHEGEKFAPAERQYVRQHNQGAIGPTDPNYLAAKGETAPPINDQTKAGFDLQQDPSIASMTPEQTAAYQAWWKANPNPTPAQLNQFFVAVGLGPAPNAQEIIAAAKEGRGISTTIENQIPQRIQERLDQRLENTGAGGAAVAGGADTITMGTFDELSALGDAVGDAFQGQGFDYSGNLAANRQFQEGLQDQHGGAYLGGQIAGGLVLPTFGASTPAQLAKVGAGYGAAYGAGSGEGMGRLGGAALGATAGAAIGGTLGKASQFVAGRRQPREVPPLVGEDGRLNEPLEALRPGQRVAAAREFGIDLPLGAATDRGGALLEKGLDILPGSAGAMNDARRVTERQVSGAVEQVAGRFGASKTLNEAGGEAQRGAREWMGRFEATASKAYDAIPISPKAQASVQATVGTIDNILARFSSNPELAAQMNSTKLQQMREAIAKGLSWEDLKALRSRIGYEIGEQRFSDSPTKDDLRAVYAALSEDMKATAAAMGPRATQAFNRANAFYRQGQQRIDQALVTLLGNDGARSPEAAAKAIQAMTQGGKGTGDLAKLAQVRAATIKSGAWDEIAGALIRIGGQPADSPGRTFSPETFVRWYADMAEPARKMLFKPELRKSLDQFVAVNQRLAGTNALRNTSNTAPGLLAGGVMGTMGVAALNPLLGAKLLGGMAANFGMAKVWTNPRFVQWATGYTKAVASGNERAVKQQIGRLSKLGTTNPELRGVIETIVRNSANDNVGPRLAADSVGDDQQGR